MTTYRLDVSRQALIEAFTALGAHAPEDTGLPLRMTHRDGLLTLAAFAAEADVPANGDWPPFADMTIYNPHEFSRLLPRSDRVDMVLDETRLTIGPTTFKVRVGALAVAPAPLTVGMTSLDLLVACEAYGRDRVVASAGKTLVEGAEHELEFAVEEAAPHFKALGIKQRDLKAAVILWLRSRAVR